MGHSWFDERKNMKRSRDDELVTERGFELNLQLRFQGPGARQAVCHLTWLHPNTLLLSTSIQGIHGS